ncbi:hypothetical protein V6N13_059336 [Hibiscus sabdariffa]|uniref:Uncharacterized protein n=1 Tax=Hibiscus sabdariffa TaxID=183260 RepID=A0ABR2GDC2_9ROSI
MALKVLVWGLRVLLGAGVGIEGATGGAGVEVEGVTEGVGVGVEGASVGVQGVGVGVQCATKGDNMEVEGATKGAGRMDNILWRMVWNREGGCEFKKGRK